MEEKLFLHKEMVESYLIQRLKKPEHFRFPGEDTLKDNPFSFGGGLKNGGLSDKAMDLIRDIFSFDYMGSSEFEWGAVPAALRFLGEQTVKDNLLAGNVELPTGVVYYISPLEYHEEVEKRIHGFEKAEPYGKTKEYVGLNQYFHHDAKDRWATDTCGWLELDNGYIFFTDKDMFEKMCQLFGVKL